MTSNLIQTCPLPNWGSIICMFISCQIMSYDMIWHVQLVQTYHTKDPLLCINSLSTIEFKGGILWKLEAWCSFFKKIPIRAAECGTVVVKFFWTGVYHRKICTIPYVRSLTGKFTFMYFILKNPNILGTFKPFWTFLFLFWPKNVQ